MAIVENLYLVLPTSAYQTVPVRPVLDETGAVIGAETLQDIFPDAPKYQLQDLVLTGVEIVKGSEVPQVTAAAESKGFTVGWGLDSETDIKIVPKAEAVLFDTAAREFEATHYLDDNGIIQPNPTI